MRELKSYRGFRIFKTWEEDITCNGRKCQTDIVYMAYTIDGDTFNCAKTLKGLKESIDSYLS